MSPYLVYADKMGSRMPRALAAAAPPTTLSAAQGIIRHWAAVHAKTSVPFYLYDHEVLGRSLAEVLQQMDDDAKCRHNIRQYAYAGEFWFLRRLVKHPWRTWDAASARVLVIPVLLGIELNDHVLHCSARTLFNSSSILRRVQRTWAWRRREAEHVFVATDFRVKRPDVLWRALWVRFDAFNQSSPIIPGPQVEFPIAFEYNEAPARNVTFFFGGQLSRRHRGYFMRWELVDQWRANRTRFNDSMLLITTDHCNSSGSAGLVPLASAPPGVVHGAYCGGRIRASRIYRRAEFALMPGGDEPASRRDTLVLQFGSIPVYMRDGLWATGLPFQNFIPYRAFSASLDEAEAKRDLAGSLGAIVRRYPPSTRSYMRLLMAYFKDDVLWTSSRSRCAENVLREADRHFQTSRNLNEDENPMLEKLLLVAECAAIVLLAVASCCYYSVSNSYRK